MSRARVLVVGGGITGLSLAYRLVTDHIERFDVTLIEEKAALGGNIRTIRQGGFVCDGGPDAFIKTKPEAKALCEELGLTPDLIETLPENRKVYMLKGGRLHALPEGMVLSIPTRVGPFLRSPLISVRGKLRAAMEPFIPRQDKEESLGELLTRRLGREVAESFGAPLMGGIYAGDVFGLSARATFPQVVALEQKFGSLVRGAAHMRPKTGGGPPASPFFSLRNGMGSLVETLVSRIQERGGKLWPQTALREVSSSLGSWSVKLDQAGERSSHVFDHVAFTTPAAASAALLRSVSPSLAEPLGEIPAVSTATVLLAFDRHQIDHPLDAVGLLCSRQEGLRIMAATFVTSKWPSRAPEGKVLLRAFLGGYADPDIVDGSSDEALENDAMSALSPLLGIHGRAESRWIFRYRGANPQPTVGHPERVARIRTLCAVTPGLHVAGASIDGVGIPDCIRQASEVARTIASHSA